MVAILTYKTLKIGHKTIATLKVIRGVLALIVSLALWRIAISGELQDVKDRLLSLSQRLDEPLINVIMDYFLQVNDQHLFLLASAVSMLAVMRFAEAIGLWSIKRWAEIFTLLSSLIYIPFELILLLKGFSIMVTAILVANILITAYLFRALRIRSRIDNNIKQALLRQ